LKLNPTVNIDAGIWLLKGLPVTETFVPGLITPAQPVEVDLPPYDLNWSKVELPGPLEFDSYEELTQSVLLNPHIGTDVKNTLQNIGYHNYIPVYITIGIVACLGMVLVLWHICTMPKVVSCRQQLCPTKSAPPEPRLTYYKPTPTPRHTQDKPPSRSPSITSSYRVRIDPRADNDPGQV